jgi:energy-coupling factor transport system ATP-binding protein
VTTLIQIENLHYRPEDLPQDQPDILRGIDLEVEQGAFVALLGENGSGKTTLIRQINGLLQPTAGQIRVDGLNPQDPHQIRALRSRVGLLFQNPADQIVASTVAEDIAFGLENANLATQEIRTRVKAELDAMGLTREANHPPHLLSGGQVQRVALAGILARSPKILLLDEPTSMLDPMAREAFLSQVIELHRQGMTVILITHHMEEAVLADRLVVLQKGKVVATGTPEEIFSQDELLHEIGLEMPESLALSQRLNALGWNLPSPILKPETLLAHLPAYTKQHSSQFTASSPALPSRSQEALIHLEDVCYTYLAGSPLAKPALTGATLQLGSGQVLGLAGTNGSGKSTLLQHINGILRPHQGTVRVGNLQVSDPDTSLKSVVQKVGMVFQSPEAQFFEVYVGDEIAYGPRQFGFQDLRERVRTAMQLVGLDFEGFKDRRLMTLSGGEMRKVALASTLVLDQDILLFDEPTAGMDPNAREDLLALFLKLNRSGKTIVIANHRLDELARVAGEFAFMHAGQVTHAGSRSSLLTNRKAISEAGLTPPLAVRISEILNEKGWPLDGRDTTTPERLIDTLREVSHE